MPLSCFRFLQHPTQTGIIRATDVASGNQITGTFVIQQTTIGGQTLAVLPLGTTTINGPTRRVLERRHGDQLHLGGTPPYTVQTISLARLH